MSTKRSDSTIDERLRKREYIIDIKRRKRVKRSEEKEVFDEVFNKSTTILIYDLMNKGIIKDFYGAIASGKESKIFYATDIKNRELAVKIYLNLNREFRRSMSQYIEGDPRFLKVPKRSWDLIQLWAKKEFVNLQNLSNAGLRVPTPYHLERNVLVMEFIGKEGKGALLLKESKLSVHDYTEVYDKVLNFMIVAARSAHLVHGDLGEYNIMLYEGTPVFFDVSQAVSIEHPLAGQLFKRDFENVKKYFENKGVNVTSLNRFIEQTGGLGFDVT